MMLGYAKKKTNTIPKAPKSRTQLGSADFCVTAPEVTVLTTAATGPTALATSLDPCANAIPQAVKIISTPKIFSTLVKRKSKSAEGSIFSRRISKMPMPMVTRPTAAAMA